MRTQLSHEGRPAEPGAPNRQGGKQVQCLFLGGAGPGFVKGRGSSDDAGSATVRPVIVTRSFTRPSLSHTPCLSSTGAPSSTSPGGKGPGRAGMQGPSSRTPPYRTPSSEHRSHTQWVTPEPLGTLHTHLRETTASRLITGPPSKRTGPWKEGWGCNRDPEPRLLWD